MTQLQPIFIYLHPHTDADRCAACSLAIIRMETMSPTHQDRLQPLSLRIFQILSTITGQPDKKPDFTAQAGQPTKHTVQADVKTKYELN